MNHVLQITATLDQPELLENLVEKLAGQADSVKGVLLKLLAIIV